MNGSRTSRRPRPARPAESRSPPPARPAPVATIRLSTVLPAAPDRVWREVLTPRALRHVAAPLVTFEPLDPPEWPRAWREGDHLVRLRLLGLVPLGRQTIGIRDVVGPPAPGRPAGLRDDGRGERVRRWDHRIVVDALPDGRTRYTDEVHVEAGAATWAVAILARLFYRHRQRRWRALARAGFRFR